MDTGSNHRIAEELGRLPPNHWVALTTDETRIVAWAPTLEEAVRKAAEAGVSDPVMERTPEKWSLLVA